MINRGKNILCDLLSGDEITAQARYRRRFNFNNFPHKFQITCWVKRFKDTGTLIKSTKKGLKSISGRNLTARSS